jgi:hypothetical protein
MNRDGLVRTDRQTLLIYNQTGMDRPTHTGGPGQSTQAQTSLDRRQTTQLNLDRQTDTDGPGRTETQTYTDLEQA